MLKSALYIVILFSTFSQVAYAQLGGQRDLNFLNLSIPARQMALGGSMVPFFDADPDMIYNNPAIIDSSMIGELSANIQVFPANIQFGQFNYVPKSIYGLNWALGTHYVNYGNIRVTDENGEKQGYFYAGEMANYISVAKNIEGVDFGANLKFVNSFLESYYAMALVTDLVANYRLDSNRINLNFAIRNLGLPLKSYTDTKLKMPLDVQFGIARKLEHMPLQIFGTVHHLNQYNLTFEDNVNNTQVIIVSDSTVQDERGQTLDKMARHLVIGGEFNFINKLYIRVAYNYLRRQEMNVLTQSISTVGYSWGLGLKFRKWNFAYSVSKYHLSGSPNSFSINIRI